MKFEQEKDMLKTTIEASDGLNGEIICKEVHVNAVNKMESELPPTQS